MAGGGGSLLTGMSDAMLPLTPLLLGPACREAERPFSLGGLRDDKRIAHTIAGTNRRRGERRYP
eukprot:29843-Prorocentrum_minimum.AAC.1